MYELKYKQNFASTNFKAVLQERHNRIAINISKTDYKQFMKKYLNIIST